MHHHDFACANFFEITTFPNRRPQGGRRARPRTSAPPTSLRAARPCGAAQGEQAVGRGEVGDERAPVRRRRLLPAPPHMSPPSSTTTHVASFQHHHTCNETVEV